MPASVDDIWKQLQTQNRPGLQIADLREVQGIQRTVRDIPRRSSVAAEPPRIAASAPSNGASAQSNVGSASSSANLSAGIAAHLQRDVNCLRDPDRSKRRSAVVSLDKKLFRDSSLQPADLQVFFAGDAVASLAHLLEDPTEKCRELSAELFLKAVNVLPQPAVLLSVLSAALCERLGSSAGHEPSEDVRLKLVRLLAALTASSGAALQQHVPSMVTLSCAALTDAFPDIKKAGCQALADVVAQVPRSELTEHHEALVSALIPNLGHQHSRIRLVCLSALQPLVGKGIAAPLLVEVVAPAMSHLAVDAAHSVRAACFAAVHDWLGHPREMSWYISLIPTLLLSCTDEAFSISSSSSAWLADAASAFPHSQQDTISMVQACLGGMLLRLAGGLDEWTVSLRCKAARTLSAALALAGSGAADHLLLLVPALRHGKGDDAAEVRQHAAKALQELGAAVPASMWLNLALEPAKLPAATDAERAVALAAVTDLVTGAGRRQQTGDAQVLSGLAEAIASQQLREAAHLGVQQHLLALVVVFVPFAGHQIQDVSQQLWLTLLQQQAWMYSSAVQGTPAADRPAAALPALQALHLPAQSAMTQLAHACSLPDAAALSAAHAPALLPAMLQEEPEWDEESLQAALFVALLHACNAQTLIALGDGIHSILEAVCVPLHRPGRLRLLLLKALQDLAPTHGQSAAAFFAGPVSERMVRRIIIPCLVWRAGPVPAVVRGCCMTLLYTFLQQQWLPAALLQDLIQGGELLPLLHQTLDDDYFAETRALACQAVQHLLLQLQSHSMLLAEQQSLLRSELQKRLDDASNSVRIAACKALSASVAQMDADAAQQMVMSIAVHMDDDDAAVREAVCAVMLALAAVQPAGVQAVVADACKMHRNMMHVQTVLQACHTST